MFKTLSGWQQHRLRFCLRFHPRLCQETSLACPYLSSPQQVLFSQAVGTQVISNCGIVFSVLINHLKHMASHFFLSNLEYLCE